MQASPSGQSPHEGPPQSVSVSVPFRTPSVQLGVWHAPPAHTRLVQSGALLQPCPGAHGPQLVPPQSRPVSLPFATPSTHEGA